MPTANNVVQPKLIDDALQRIVNDIRMLVVGIDTKGNIIYANPYFLMATGYTKEEVLDRDIYDIFIPVNKIETFDKKIQAIIQNNYSMQSENPILKKDGVKLYVDWNNVPITDNGVVVGVLSVGVDITPHVELVHLLSLNEKTMRDRADLYAKQNADLEELEAALQAEKKNVEKKVDERTAELNEEKARLLASINSFPHGFLVTDTNDNVVLTNEKLNTIFDLKRNEWHLNDLRDLLSGAVNFLKYYGLVKTSKKPYLIKDIDLERKFLDIYVAPIFLSPLSSETIGNIILVTDITEQKIIERSKEEFFSIASHELRTPLTTIRGNAELLRKHFAETLSDTQFAEIVDDIEASSERLISLVNEFLNMSRLEQGKMQFKQEVFNICEIVDEVVKELKTTAESKNLFLRPTYAENSCVDVVADKDRVREVLINLIGNALTYSDKGGVSVSIEPADKHVKIAVADTGKGITTQNQNLLFRKFQQANVNLYTRDASRSTGLGLYISKLMVEAMRGSIYLERSEVNVGSTFVFTLPIA